MLGRLKLHQAMVTGIASATLLAACAQQPLKPSSPDIDKTWTFEQAIHWARADFGQSLGIDADAVTIISAKSVIWASGARGCPRPGQTYTQALVSGHQIVLENGDQRAYYHAGDSERPFRCPEKFRVPPSRAGATVM